jgi:hypothetical protein
VTFTIEVDFAANNTWHRYAQFTVAPNQTLRHVVPEGYSAHWIRVKSDTTTTATAQFTYGPSAPLITGATILPGGAMQLTFTGSPGQPYTVRASSDLALPLANWPALTSGIFATNTATYLDTTTVNAPRRFYLITIP